jgi:uncharacterized integral membrane protein
MVAALILILLVCIFLAFFVGKNITNLCTFWLFKTYTDLSVTVIVFIAFAAGIVFSLLCYLAARLMKSSKKSETDNANKTEKPQQKKQGRFDFKMDKFKVGKGKKADSQEKSDDAPKADEKAENDDNKKSDVDSSSKTSDKEND